MRAFLVALILIASGASAAAPGEPQLAAYLEEHGKSPEDYVISKFADHQIVFLGEYHRIRHDVELVQRLMPLLYKAGIHNLGIEFGAEELQAEADRLVTADVYDPLLARSLMFRWEPWWGYHEYIELYHAAWDVNRSRPKGAAPFRIVNLGYRVDFSQLQGERTPEVMRKVFARGDTDVFMADVIRREFLDKGEKALIYSGSHHAFTRYRQPIYNPDTNQVVRRMDDRMGNLVYQRAPDKVFTILLHYPVDSLSQPSNMIRPGNGMIDLMVQERGLGRYDEDGRYAAAGIIDRQAMSVLLDHPFLSMPPPKSLDRFDFPLDPIRALSVEHAATTLTAFAVRSMGVPKSAHPLDPMLTIPYGSP